MLVFGLILAGVVVYALIAYLVSLLWWSKTDYLADNCVWAGILWPATTLGLVIELVGRAWVQSLKKRALR